MSDKTVVSNVVAFQKKVAEAQSDSTDTKKPVSTKKPPKKMPPPPPKKKVWFKCRAEGCPGDQAELSEIGQASKLGKVVLMRYRCLTCGKLFQFQR